MREGKKSEGAFKAPPPPDGIGLKPALSYCLHILDIHSIFLHPHTFAVKIDASK